MAGKKSGGKPPSRPPSKPPAKAPPRQSSPEISTLAAKVMNKSLKPTPAQMRRIAASVVSQDQTKGQKPKGKPTP